MLLGFYHVLRRRKKITANFTCLWEGPADIERQKIEANRADNG